MPIDRRTAAFIKDSGSMPTAPATDSTPPSAPGAPIKVSSTDFEVTISYAASASSEVTHYLAYADGAAMPCGKSAGPELTMVLTGLAPGMHSIAVYAVDAAGNFSAASGAASIAQPRPGDREKGIFPTLADLPPASEFVGVAQVDSNNSINTSNGKNYRTALTTVKQVDRPKPKIINLISTGHSDNLIPARSEAFTLWLAPNQLTGATVTRSTVDGITNDTSTVNVPLGGRGFEILSTGSLGLVDGQRYAFTVDVKNMTGRSTEAFRPYNAKIAMNVPLVAANNNKRVGFYFVHNAAANGQYIRIGSGINGAALASQVLTVTFTNPAIYPVDDDGFFYDYVAREAFTSYLPANTFDADNNVVSATGQHIDYVTKKRGLVMITGDSFINDTNDFPQLVNASENFVVESYGYPGVRLESDITTNFAANLAKNAYDIVVIEGGSNDLNAVTNYITNMQTDLTSACDACDSAEIPVVLLDVAPLADISSDTAKLNRWLLWNRWLAQFAHDRGYELVKMSDLLADPTGLYRMNPVYVSGEYTGDYTYTGDTTHPTVNGGMQVIADALIDKLDVL